MSDNDRFRLATIQHLVIDITPSGLASFQRSMTQLQALQGSSRATTDNVARVELDGLLREAIVTFGDWAAGETVRVRRRDKPREIDLEAQLLVVAPTHARCTYARARYDPRNKASGDAEHIVKYVYGRDRKIGLIRVSREGPANPEYRPVASDPESSHAPPWGSVPEHAWAALRQVERNVRTLEWLESVLQERPAKSRSGSYVPNVLRAGARIEIRCPEALRARALALVERGATTVEILEAGVETLEKRMADR